MVDDLVARDHGGAVPCESLQRFALPRPMPPVMATETEGYCSSVSSTGAGSSSAAVSAGSLALGLRLGFRLGFGRALHALTSSEQGAWARAPHR